MLRRKIMTLRGLAVAVLTLAVSLLVMPEAFKQSEVRAGAFACPDTLEVLPTGTNLASGPYTCFPTCTTNDAKMMTVAGDALFTLIGQKLTIGFRSPGGSPTLEIGIFDGDTHGFNTTTLTRPEGGIWDVVSGLGAPIPLKYTIFADANGDGDADSVTPIATLLGDDINGDAIDQGILDKMKNDDWSNVLLCNANSALSPSGAYLYIMTIEFETPVPLGLQYSSSFKLRTDGAILIKPQPIAFLAPVGFGAEAVKIYPNLISPACPNPQFPIPACLAGTTYDGMWNFNLDIMSGDRFVLWDGDFDRNGDDEDGNTPGIGVDTNPPALDLGLGIPLWAVGTGANPEGAVPIGVPEDDNTSFGLLLRTPAIKYTVTDPLNNVYVNDNPSGNLEWEQFLITNGPSFGTPDYPAPAQFPYGKWNLKLEGVDAYNLFALRFFNATLTGQCVPEPGKPCEEIPRTFVIGDKIWRDSDCSGGLQTASNNVSEPGIPGVLVELLDSNNTVVATTLTDANGEYSFAVDAGQWTTRVAASNFAAGGALEGLTPSQAYGGPNGGNQRTQTVTTDNILTYDYSYCETPAQGCAFLVIDEDSIDNGNPPNFFKAKDVNDDIAYIGVRSQLRYFAANVGKTITLHTGTVGDEGWFAVKTIPTSWNASGGIAGFIGNPSAPVTSPPPHGVGPGLGAPLNGDREKLLDKIPNVTPLRATGLKNLIGKCVCAVVYDSDVSINYGPLNGSLKGANLGTVAFRVLSVTKLNGYSSSSLPKVQIEILDARQSCNSGVTLLTDAEAPPPKSSSQPHDVNP